ncbi:DUF2490 domain-containing protein [Sphingomonas sp. S2-65]|uniref:DUF2490 domain-containing protein n=1 Tax=Sphingomonas sp. S2-65 TaxID=2903960 RepID=UPI001F2D8332|nr:DUF2490 domain-containing protein [Sphingomonas sp. S2-65]UYY60148.1 DUF2490 domain-containing protein [Sphingomonas sp. S2-65]
MSNRELTALRLPILAVALSLLPLAAQAQSEDAQLWTQTNVNVGLGDDTRVTLEGIARWSDRQDGLFHTELGGIVSHKLSKHVEIGIGYRHVAGYGGNTADDENRLRQYVVLNFGRITARFRIDERFHPDGNEIGVRIRPLLRYNHPLARNVALFASHESFFMANTTQWGQRAGYDRMRNLIGVTLPLVKDVSADIGYLNQYRFARGGAGAQMDHALSLTLTVNL